MSSVSYFFFLRGGCKIIWWMIPPGYLLSVCTWQAHLRPRWPSCGSQRTFLSPYQIWYFTQPTPPTFTMGGADCAEGHSDTWAEWLTFPTPLALFQRSPWTTSLCMYTARMKAYGQQWLFSLQKHSLGKVVLFWRQTIWWKRMMNFRGSRWMRFVRVYRRLLGIYIFSIYVSATFSSCYEKLIFLLTLLQKDMSLCAPIQDNQVILVHMPPHISPPAPWPLSSAKSYLPSGLYGVSTRS